MIAGILLAAGESSRMGQPKALLPFNGVSFIDTILNNLVQAGCDPVISILGKSADLICKQTDVDNFLCVNNPQPERGMLSSLKLAIRELPAQAQGFILSLVDHPAVKANTYYALFSEARANPDRIIIPDFFGRHGHPVYFGRNFFDALLEAPEDLGARYVVQRYRDRVTYLPVDDEGVILDIDTPEDYGRLVN